MASKKSKKVSERQKFVMMTAEAQERELQAMRDIADDVIESDFVPYACLYDNQTILTKDGEPLQTIRINGLGFETSDSHSANQSLRQAIRGAIRACLPDASYAIWLHTLRRQKSMGGRNRYPDAFSGQLDEAWRAQHPSSVMFSNELYVTIVKAGEGAPLRNLKGLLRSIRPAQERRTRSEEVTRRVDQLTRITQKMLDMLAPYGAQLLKVEERDGLFYSEQLEFLEKLINLEARAMPLPMRDLSQVLTSGEITFGYNAMEVRTFDNHRRFAAILSLKEYKESTLKGIDKFLEIPCEVIVTQCFSFTGAEEAQEAYAKQARYLAISGDKQLAEWMEIDRLMQLRTAGAREYGEQQTTLFLIAPSVRQLEANVKLVHRSLSRLGIVVVREDLRFEECYWGQLPGNFPFVARKSAVDTEHLAGFANLQSTPMGVASGSPWGPPVSLLTTVQELPYFFNFHRGASAHTIILGKQGTGRTSFTHFLLSQARHLPVSIWYVDAHGRGKHWIQAVGGTYLTPCTADCKINPFHMTDNPGNREFLALWLSTLIDPHGAQLNRSTLSFFQSIVNHVMGLPAEQRRLSNVLPMVREADALLAVKLQPFCAGGAYGELFDMPGDNFAVGPVVGWDISRWMGDPITRIPLTSYLLHRLTGRLDGKPTLLVLDEGFSQLDTPLFASRAGAWCDYLTSQNAAVILTSEHPEESGAHSFSQSLAQKAATIFAMPDNAPSAEYAMGFGFSDQEIATVAYINHHQVLQKRGSEAVVLSMKFSMLSDVTRATLRGRPLAADLPPAEQLAALMGYGAKETA